MKRTLGVTKIHRGSPRAQAVLSRLEFDPITAMVNKYRELEEELAYQKKLRSGAVLELTSQGKPRAYRAEIHLSIFDKQLVVAKELLRYKYGRVSEGEQNDKPPLAPMVVQLTSEGDTHVINDGLDEEDSYGDVDHGDDVVDVVHRDSNSHGESPSEG